MCADDDAGTTGNPGVTKATAAALSVGGTLAMPDFGGNRPEGVSDLNDMSALVGVNAVKGAVEGALSPSDLHKHLVSFDNLTDCDLPQPHFVDRWIPAGEVTL